MLTIRPASLSDAQAIQAIYTPQSRRQLLPLNMRFPVFKSLKNAFARRLKNTPIQQRKRMAKCQAMLMPQPIMLVQPMIGPLNCLFMQPKRRVDKGLDRPFIRPQKRSCKHEATYAFWLVSLFRTKRAFPCMKSGAMFKWLISQRLAISLTNGMISSGCKRPQMALSGKYSRNHANSKLQQLIIPAFFIG